MKEAKLFWSGRSQAVRLPKEFRFPGDQVRIHRRGNAVILEPLTADWSWLDQTPEPFDADFVAAVNEPVPEQIRSQLDTFLDC